jgi:hypothetical protein
MWGSGDRVSGELSFGEIREGRIVVLSAVSREELSTLQSKKVSGLVTGSLSLKDFTEIQPDFPVVVIEGFGEEGLRSDVAGLLAASSGKLACIDPSTQLRAGVQRPRIIIPKQSSS